MPWQSGDWMGLAAVITAAASVVSAFRSNAAAKKGNEAVAKVGELEIKVDGRLSQLLALTASSSRAEGHIEGVDSERVQVASTAAVSDPAAVSVATGDPNKLVIGIPTPMPPVLLVPVENGAPKQE